MDVARPRLCGALLALERRILKAEGIQLSVRTVKSWAEFYRTQPAFADALMQVASHTALLGGIGAGARVLEVGAGSGSLSGFLSGRAHVTVVEPDPGVARTARRNPLMVAERVAFVRGDGMRLPFRRDSFDVVYSQGLFEHFADEDVRRFVSEGLRVAPVVLSSVPSRWYPHLGKVLRPALRGDERLLPKEAWCAMIAPVAAHCHAAYYADAKLATIAGRTLPWPTHVLLTARRGT